MSVIGARFAPNVPSSQKSFWAHPLVLLGDEAQVEACFGPFGDGANLDANGCAVYVECTIGLEIILDAPDGTPR